MTSAELHWPAGEKELLAIQGHSHEHVLQVGRFIDNVEEVQAEEEGRDGKPKPRGDERSGQEDELRRIVSR